MIGLMHRLRILLVVLIFFVLFTLGESGVSLAIAESEAALRIDEAENAVNSAYIEVLDAEENGTDVSTLLLNLNFGARNISKAEMLYRVGDFEGAVYYADLSIQSVDGVVEEAEQLQILASDQFREKSFQTVTMSFVAIVVIILGSVISWQLFKKHYFQNLLKMRPEEAEA